jgi:hypothetical protein
MTEDERAPRTDKVQVAVAIDVPDPGTITTRDERWPSTDRAMGTNRAVDAARNEALRLLKECG